MPDCLIFFPIRAETLTYRNNKNTKVTGGKKHERNFGIWGGGKSAGGAHRNSKAKSAFLDGRAQT
jgi:hypothetical protein